MSENAENIIFKNRFRFTETYDLHLLREVYGQNPYQDPKRWYTIQTNLIQITGKSVSIQTLRERVQNLVKKYLSKAKLNEGLSGIEIEVTELDDLLQQIADLIRVFQNNKNNIICKPDLSSYQKGFNARENATRSLMEPQAEHSGVPVDFVAENSNVVYETELEINNIEESDIKRLEPTPNATKRKSLAQNNISTPKCTRASGGIRQNTVQYLSSKNERNYELKSRELAIQERKQALEEKKYELDSYERKKRLEMEERKLAMEEERLKIQMGTFSNQQEIIKLMFDKIASVN